MTETTAPETAPETTQETEQDWIGRAETREGCLTPVLAGMLGAALGHEAAAQPDLAPGAPCPWLWHWGAFPEFVPHGGLGGDGHPRLGGFLPPLPFPRRMWAGGALRFTGRLRIGEPLTRRSTIRAVTRKDGSTGRMAFVTVAHEITGAHGGRVDETQDIVYLDIPDSFRPPRRVAGPARPDFDEPVAIDTARLFRFSAATFNAHRIHYDLPYAREVEKYPALVVHGPMQAMLLIEAATRHTATRHSGAAPQGFRFRGLHPMFHDHDLALTGTEVPGDAPGVHRIDLATVAPEGFVGLEARMDWTS